MRVEHPRGFVTQYKYRDHSFEDSLKPAPALQKLREAESKEAFVTGTGTVIVRNKADRPARAATRDEHSAARTATASHHGSGSNPSLRKVQSANFESALSGRAALRRDLAASRNLAQTQLDPWKPGDAVPRCLEKEKYVPVIHPKPYVPAPHRVIPPSLLNRPKTDFLKFISTNNRELFVLSKTHLPEKPPRYFYDHRKPEFDFFKNIREQASDPATEKPAPVTKARPATMGLRTKSELKLIGTTKDSTTAVPASHNFPPRVKLDPLASH
jgi:hypothetical protein